MKADIGSIVSMAFKAIHNLRVLHRDAEPRNILYNTTSCGLMVVDFERAEFHGRQPLASIRLNENRKRKRWICQKQKKDDFVRELEIACDSGATATHATPPLFRGFFEGRSHDPKK
ncbi:hypothetical protein MANI_027774 [Metarhizium anisopliae]|nr:hypothetical protein MANI_027774 [Metarhizium anisopliae]